MPSSPYLSGSFVPVHTEVTALAADFRVTGSLPAKLEGRYLRNGPNPLIPDDRCPRSKPLAR
jgi:carotenoid cleavage dioxygenase